MKKIESKSYKMALMSPDSLEQLKNHGEVIKDQFFVGPYELYLIYNGSFGIHQLAIQTKETQAISLEDQNKKIPKHKDSKLSYVNDLKNKVSEWKLKYKTLYVGSYNKDKVNKYNNILQKLGFKTQMGEMNGYIYFTI